MSAIAHAASTFKDLSKRVAQHAARRFGLHVYRAPLPNTLPNRLRYVLGRLDINCVIDVGAHYGEYGQSLRELGYRGRIVSFEPIGASYERLRSAAASDPSWRQHHCALGAEESELEINVFAASDLSSFLPTSYKGERFGEGLGLERRERVRVRPLSAVFGECVEGLANPRVLLKLDTQGYDFAVLEGARPVLSFIAALQSEVAVRPLYEGMTLLPEAVSRYQAMGFEVAGMYPVSLETDNLRVIEFDCLMVRGLSGQPPSA